MLAAIALGVLAYLNGTGRVDVRRYVPWLHTLGNAR
jgi:hypothetical protein